MDKAVAMIRITYPDNILPWFQMADIQFFSVDIFHLNLTSHVVDPYGKFIFEGISEVQFIPGRIWKNNDLPDLSIGINKGRRRIFN